MRRIALPLLCIVLGAIFISTAQAQFSSDYQTNIISGVVSNWNGDYFVGSNTAFDLLQIERGGVLSDASGYIGYESSASNNFVLVRGSGSVWSNSGTLYIGHSSIGNNLTITNGGMVWAQDLTVGYLNGSQGTVNVGGGSVTANQITLADTLDSTGTFSATEANVVASSYLWIGSGGDATMSLSNCNASVGLLDVAGTLTASESMFSVSGSLSIGDFTAGTVWITGGQLVATNGGSYVANLGTGQMTCSNSLVNLATVTVSASSIWAGTLSVSGGSLISRQFDVGHGGPGSTGAVWICDGATVTATNDPSIVGESGIGSITVSNSTVRLAALTLGKYTLVDTQGTLTVAGGTVTVTGTLTLGEQGFGGTPVPLTKGTIWLADGVLIATNAPTYIGLKGGGEMTISNGTVQAYSIVVGSLAGSRGVMTLAGGTSLITGGLTVGDTGGATGTVWFLNGLMGGSGAMSVGNNGVGDFTMSNGTMQVRCIEVGQNAGSSGTFTLAGGNITLGPGCFLSTGFELGGVVNSRGTAWIKGGELDSSAADIFVGESGSGTLVVSNGTVLTRSLLIAIAGLGEGKVTIAGGTSSTYSNLTIGDLSCTTTGTMAITSGSVFVTNAAHNAVLEVRNGTLTVNGGTVVADIVVVTNACGHFVHTGGSLIINTLVLDPNLSAVGDGIPNGWKQLYGFDPFDPSVASADPDGDGQNNLAEFLAGTDPTNSDSAFRITSISQEGADIRVTWQTGIGRTNALQSSAGDSGLYTNSFADIFTVTNTVGTTTNFLDIGAATNAPSRYYRIRLVP